MNELFPFFIVLFAALFFSEVFRRFHFPWVIALILGGMIIGPHGFDIFAANDTISFLGEVGLVFLMFMAGLETNLSSSGLRTGKAHYAALINGAIPFAVGMGIGLLLGYSLTAAVLIGIIFISSSVAVIIPSLQDQGLLHTKLGRTIVASTILEDIASLMLLSLFLHSVTPTNTLPLPLFFFLLVVVVLFLRWVIPRIRWFFSNHIMGPRDLFQQELRSIFFVMIGTVVAFELMGLHAIIAGFFAGLVLSGSIMSDLMKEKLRAISYGLFIPVFFILVGTETDLGVFREANDVLFVVIVIVMGLGISKFTSGWLAGRVAGYGNNASALMGAATIPQLSTSLAVTFTGLSLGILDQKLITAIVILSIATTFTSPFLVKYFNKRYQKEKGFKLVPEQKVPTSPKV